MSYTGSLRSCQEYTFLKFKSDMFIELKSNISYLFFSGFLSCWLLGFSDLSSFFGGFFGLSVHLVQELDDEEDRESDN